MSAGDEYRAWRSPCAPSAACGLPSERSRPRSTRPAPWSRRRWATRSVVARRIGSTPFGLNGTDDDFGREPPRGTNGGFFLAEGASERARSHALMASIRARGRTLSRVHDAWALSRSTSGSRGFVTGSSIASECQMERGIHGKGIRRGVADIIASTSRSMHSAHDEWRAWTAAVTQRDVDRVLRRVNRRIETGVVALPKGSRCLEDDHSWIEADVALEPDFTAPCKVHETTHATPRGTLVFLHGFGDDAAHWREFTELLVRGIPGGFDVVLPAAPNRKFQIAGQPRRSHGVVRAEDEAHARGRMGRRYGYPAGWIAVDVRRHRRRGGVDQAARGRLDRTTGSRAGERPRRGVQPGRGAGAGGGGGPHIVVARAGGGTVPARVPPTQGEIHREEEEEEGGRLEDVRDGESVRGESGCQAAAGAHVPRGRRPGGAQTVGGGGRAQAQAGQV